MEREIRSSSPPLYYSLLHTWVILTGTSEVAVRLLSTLASTLSLAVLYLLGRQLFGSDVALITVSLMAVSPLDIWYAQEARMYTLVTLTGLLFSLGLVCRHWMGAFLAGSVLAVGLYLDYTVVPLWVGISAIWFVILWQAPQRIRYYLFWLISSAGAWFIYQPWLPHMRIMLGRLNDVVFFLRVQSMAGLPPFSAQHYLLGMAAAGLGVFIAAYLSSRWLQHNKFLKRLTPVFLLVFASAILLFAVPRFYSIKRIVVTGWPFVILFAAWVIAHLERRKKRVWQGLLILSLFSSLVTLATPKDDWRSVAAFFKQNDVSGTVIWVDPRWNKLAYEYYGPLQEARYGQLDELKEAAQKNEIWLIAERYLGQPVPSSDSETWLDGHLQLVDSVSFYRLELRHYSP